MTCLGFAGFVARSLRLLNLGLRNLRLCILLLLLAGLTGNVAERRRVVLRAAE